MAVGQDPAVEIRARLNAEDAKNSARSLAAELLGSITPTLDVANLAAKAWSLLGDAVSAVTGFVREGVAAAAESEATQTKLAAALRASGDATGEVFGRLSAYNTILLRKIGLDDDDSAALQMKLLALGVQRDQLEAATRATIGLSEATGKDLSASAKQVARAFKEGGDEADRLQGLFSLAVEKSETFTGKLQLLDARVGALKESVGGLIIENESVVAGVDRWAGVVEIVNGKLAAHSEGLKEAATAGGETISMGAALSAIMIEVGDQTFRAMQEIGNVGGHFDRSNPGVLGAKQVWTGLKDAILGVGDELIRVQQESDKAVELARLGVALARSESDRQPKLDFSDEVDLPGVDLGAIPKGKLGSEIRDRLGVREKDRRTSKADPAAAAAVREAERLRLEAVRLGMQEAEDTERERLAGLKQRVDQEAKLLDYEGEIREYHAARREANRQRLENSAALEEESRQRELDQQGQFWGQLGGVVGSGVSNYLSQLAIAAAAQKSFDGGALLGGMLVSIGQAAVALGTTAILAGTVGQLVPFLFPATGGAAGALAGAALVAGGLGAIALGARMGGAGGSPETGATPAVAGAGARGGVATGVPSGFIPEAAGAPNTTIINVTLGAAAIVGTEREVGQKLTDILRKSNTLNPGRRVDL